MKTRVDVGYGVCALLLAVAYAAVGGGSAAVLLQAVLVAGATLAVLLGVARHRPQPVLAWGGVLAGLVGLTVASAAPIGLATSTTPAAGAGWPDVLRLASCASLACGIVVLARRRSGAEPTALVDAAISTLGLGVPVWVFLVLPVLRSDHLGTSAQLVAVASPLVDLALVGALALLWWSPGDRGPAFRLLGAGAIPVLGTDLTLVVEAVQGTAIPPGVVAGGWALTVACWGAAALHPSIRQVADDPASAPAVVSEPAPPRTGSRGRTASLMASALVAPGVLLVQGLRGLPVDAVPIAVASMLLVVFAMLRVAGLARELTESVARQRGQERFRALVQSGSDLITLLRSDGSVSYSSPSVERLLGLPADLVVDRPLVELAHPDDAPRLSAHLAAALAGGTPGSIELRLRAADGGWRWLETVGRRLVADGDAGGLVVTSRDVTERRTLAEQLTRQACTTP